MGQWVVQGRGGTNPVNKKQGIKNASGPALKIKTGSVKSGIVSPDEKTVCMVKVAKRVKPSNRFENKDTDADTREAVPDPTSAGAKNTVPLDMGG